MRTIGEKLDNLLDRDTREYLNSEPEYASCPACLGVGYTLGKITVINGIDSEFEHLECITCDGTGRVLKIKFTIEEE